MTFSGVSTCVEPVGCSALFTSLAIFSSLFRLIKIGVANYLKNLPALYK